MSVNKTFTEPVNWRCFTKKAVHKSFQNCWPEAANLLKRYFPQNFVEFFRTDFLQKICRS